MARGLSAPTTYCTATTRHLLRGHHHTLMPPGPWHTCMAHLYDTCSRRNSGACHRRPQCAFIAATATTLLRAGPSDGHSPPRLGCRAASLTQPARSCSSACAMRPSWMPFFPPRAFAAVRRSPRLHAKGLLDYDRCAHAAFGFASCNGRARSHATTCRELPAACARVWWSHHWLQPGSAGDKEAAGCFAAPSGGCPLRRPAAEWRRDIVEIV